MDRLKRIKILKPICLYKKDLFEIEQILKKLIDCKGCDLSITPIDHGHAISGTPFHSFVDLFEVEKLPERVRQITIEAKEINANRELMRDAQIFIGKHGGHLRVLAKDDEAWVNKAFEELAAYLDSKIVWFSLAARAIPPIFNTSMAITFMLTMLALLTDVYSALLYPIILALSAITMLSLNLSGTVYSFTRVNLFPQEEENRTEHEKYLIWLYFTILLSCIGGALAETWHIITGN